jgi:hypothetical protein
MLSLPGLCNLSNLPLRAHQRVSLWLAFRFSAVGLLSVGDAGLARAVRDGVRD